MAESLSLARTCVVGLVHTVCTLPAAHLHAQILSDHHAQVILGRNNKSVSMAPRERETLRALAPHIAGTK